MGTRRFNERNHIEYQTSLNESITGDYEFQKETHVNNKTKMKPYICLIHGLRFWRNEQKKFGVCSFCRTFNIIKNKRLDIMAYEKEEGMNFVEWTKEGQEVEGKLINKLTEFGDNDTTVYVIETDNGKLVSVWETGFLSTLMTNVKIEDRLKIVYKGLGEAKKKGYNQPKMFDVFVDR